jgi:integrase
MIPIKRKILKRGVEKWELDYGRDAQGVRRRPFFDSEAEADDELKKYAKEARRQGEYWAAMTDVERTTVISVLQEVKAAKLELGQVWQEFKHRKKEMSSQATTSPMAYADVVAEFNRRKLAAGKTTRYTDNTTKFFARFGAGRERQNIHEITTDDLEKWLDAQVIELKWSMSTKRTYVLLFSSRWEVAIDKGWALTNITERLEQIVVRKPTLELYENKETLNIMAAAMSSPTTQQIIAPLALGFWGCMRPEEIDSSKAKSEGMPESEFFKWSDIDLKHGLCKVRVTKKGDERTIQLQPCAIEWLKLAKELQNPLPPVNERRLVNEICELINLVKWIRDGARKSCATHLRAVLQNDFLVVAELGNSVKVLLKYYAALHVPPSTSLEHWKITPDRVKEYMKTKAWAKVKLDAAKATAERLANEISKSEN